LLAGVVLAVLLLANSIRDYLFVSHLLATQQVRHQMTQHIAALEQQLRQTWKPGASRLKFLTDDLDRANEKALWIEIRSPDGDVHKRYGTTETRVFSNEEASTSFRNREPLYKVVANSAGDLVVEAFPVYASAPPGAPPAGAPPSGRRSLLIVEIAMPLASGDPSVLRTQRWNLFINSASALALLATVVIAGLGFRSYVRGKLLEQQMEIAHEVQSKLLPSQPGDFGQVRLATEYRPAEQVGGDFYDVFGIEGDGIALVMGDVSGKGVPAALLMGVIHGAVRSSSWTESAAHHELESERLNRLLCEHASGERFASMFWCYYDPPTRLLRYVNAGHCPPLLAANRKGQLEVVRLEAGGPVLGILQDAHYRQSSLELLPGDVLLMYSDGLIEATNPLGEEYGEGRLRAVLASVNTGSPEEIRRAVFDSTSKFLGASAPQDDLTFVVSQFT
jgi:sigma-B regulation protein RsbU (phosphoserine phosphatase)